MPTPPGSGNYYPSTISQYIGGSLHQNLPKPSTSEQITEPKAPDENMLDIGYGN
jgi:hypothetical protein